MFSPWYRLFPHKTLIADSYFYHVYFWRDPCSSMKPGVHTVGRSVGRRALLFTVCSPSKWHFDCREKLESQTVENEKRKWYFDGWISKVSNVGKLKRFFNVSSSLELHCCSQDSDYCLSEIECFESFQQKKKCKMPDITVIFSKQCHSLELYQCEISWLILINIIVRNGILTGVGNKVEPSHCSNLKRQLLFCHCTHLHHWKNPRGKNTTLTGEPLL